MHCPVGNMIVNHLMFADDYVCMFSPSINGLQCLLNILFVVTTLLNTKSLLINCNKQFVVFFAQKSINNLSHKMFF